LAAVGHGVEIATIPPCYPEVEQVHTSTSEFATRRRFNALAELWERETINSSSLREKIDHWAYRQIIDMEDAALPLIYERLATRGGYWFPALREITRTDPVPVEWRGNVRKMRAAWLKQWVLDLDDSIYPMATRALFRLPETPEGLEGI
jgi:hypothetical protein